MNKIEAAINMTKNFIKRTQLEKIEISAKLESYEDGLLMLEQIQRDNSIPHEENKVSETFLNVKNI